MSHIHASCFPCARYGIVAYPCVDHKIDRDPPQFKVMSNEHKHSLLDPSPCQQSQHVFVWVLHEVLDAFQDCATPGSTCVTSLAG